MWPMFACHFVLHAAFEVSHYSVVVVTSLVLLDYVERSVRVDQWRQMASLSSPSVHSSWWTVVFRCSSDRPASVVTATAASVSIHLYFRSLSLDEGTSSRLQQQPAPCLPSQQDVHQPDVQQQHPPVGRWPSQPPAQSPPGHPARHDRYSRSARSRQDVARLPIHPERVQRWLSTDAFTRFLLCLRSHQRTHLRGMNHRSLIDLVLWTQVI